MFTVKHIDSDGNETLHGGVTGFQRIVKPYPTQGDPLGQDQPGVKLAFADGCQCHYGESSVGRAGDKLSRIYVMNETGATVATYDL